MLTAVEWRKREGETERLAFLDRRHTEISVCFFNIKDRITEAGSELRGGGSKCREGRVRQRRVKLNIRCYESTCQVYCILYDQIRNPNPIFCSLHGIKKDS